MSTYSKYVYIYGVCMTDISNATKIKPSLKTICKWSSAKMYLEFKNIFHILKPKHDNIYKSDSFFGKFF